MLRFIALGCLLCGCAQLFGLDTVPGIPDTTSDAFDVASCPPSYDLPAPDGAARYRLLLIDRPLWSQSDACAADLEGSTHLAVIDSTAELDALIQITEAATGDFWWIGAVQQPDQTSLDAGWIWITGGSVHPDLWNTGEPNDADHDEVDHLEQFTRLWRAHAGIADWAGSVAAPAVCECDGRAITDEARTLIANH